MTVSHDNIIAMTTAIWSLFIDNMDIMLQFKAICQEELCIST